jgi:tetratricopeptide (TPR) repeat protein
VVSRCQDASIVSRQRAEAWLELASSDPGRVVTELDLIEAFVLKADPDSAAIALRAAGLASANRLDMNAGLRLLERAFQTAKGATSETAAEVDMTYGAVLSWAGRTQEADQALTRAIANLNGSRLGRALVQRGTVRGRLSLFEDALDDFRAAEQLLDPEDRAWWGGLWWSRGTVIAFTGDHRQADLELRRAQDWFRQMGNEDDVAVLDHSRGWVAGISGDIPKALELFDSAERQYEVLGRPLGELWRDRCDVLLAAQLVPEALASARRSVDHLTETGFVAAADEARLRLARAALLDADFASAELHARRAKESFQATNRPGWALMATAVALQAELLRTGGDADLMQRAEQLAGDSSILGMSDLAIGAQLSAVQAALGSERFDRAQDLLANIPDRPLRLDLDLTRLLSVARLRAAEGDTASALRAARKGMKLIGAQQAMLGDAEVRAGMAAYGSQLGSLGLQLAAASGSSRRMFDWFERTRAGALRYPIIRPPEDEVLATDLARLRSIDAMASGLLSEGIPLEVQQRRARLERAVRHRWRHSPGSGFVGKLASAAGVLSALDEKTCLIELGVIENEITALTLSSGRVRRRSLGIASSFQPLIDPIGFDLARLAARRQSQFAMEATAASLAASLSDLDQRLLQGLAVELPENVVIVPSPELQNIPWSLLPTLRERAVAVSPSATVWLQRLQTQAPRAGTLFIAGPGLVEAWPEVIELGQWWTDASELPPTASRAEEVMGRLAANGVAHLACHGRFRADSPMFSSLEMADGPLYVYDLYRLTQSPSVMVLSACDVGQAALRPGSEVLGVVAALLGVGCRSVVASVGLVPDLAGTRRFMSLFHQELASGQRPSMALARARRETDWSDPLQYPAAAFTCFGA